MTRFAFLLAATLVAVPFPALAHKVVAGLFPSGSNIEGEVGFSNGDMAVHETFQIHDPEGNHLGEVTTDDDGFFVYTPTSPVTHIFDIDLGAGHAVELRMEAEEVAKLMGKAVPPAPAAPAPMPAADVTSDAPGVTIASLSEEEKRAIAEIVRDETRPLRREISALKETHGLQSILGGIGYIFGIFGLGFYLAARRKLKDAA